MSLFYRRVSEDPAYLLSLHLSLRLFAADSLSFYLSVGKTTPNSKETVRHEYTKRSVQY